WHASATGCEVLGDVERVATRHVVDLAGGLAGACRERGDPFDGKRSENQALTRIAREIASEGGEACARCGLVIAERDDRENGRRADASHEKPQEVERGIIGPMDIF